MRSPQKHRLGDDQGCFAAALNAVKKFGGVIEHPAHSRAWDAFNITKPKRYSAWIPAGLFHPNCWTCYVEQGHYGHFTRKPTWLFYHSPQGNRPPTLIHTQSNETTYIILKSGRKQSKFELASKKQRSATPRPFAELLIQIAQHAVTQNQHLETQPSNPTTTQTNTHRLAVPATSSSNSSRRPRDSTPPNTRATSSIPPP
ncbi:MAG: hypothetical protein N2692_03100 [Patescibacteria group bacterium]|nr:hypothetical protein [Patescibacteria group bacterium]